MTVPSALATLRGLFVEQPVYFFVGDESKKTDQWSGLWPIAGSAWEHVVAPKDSGSPIVAKLERESDGQHDRSMWSISSITLNLKDLGVREFKNPLGTAPIPGSSEKMDSLPWAAALWPNFEAPGWDYYLAGGFWEAYSKPVLLEDFDLKGNARTSGERQAFPSRRSHGSWGSRMTCSAHGSGRRARDMGPARRTCSQAMGNCRATRQRSGVWSARCGDSRKRMPF